MDADLLPIDEDEREVVNVRELGGEVVVTTSDHEESVMVTGALTDGGRALIGVLADRFFRFRSNGKVMAWRCAKCGGSGRAPAWKGMDIINEHRHWS